MWKIFGAAVVALAIGTSGVLAAGSDTPSTTSQPSDYDKAVKLNKSGDYGAAEVVLTDVVAKQPKNADAWNELGFAQRKQEKFDEAFASYNQALLINPEHDGANEYLGELYLQTGDLAKAEAQLAVLDGNCSFSCDEYNQLKDAIAAYKKKQGS